jgi:hypothetical protein
MAVPVLYYIVQRNRSFTDHMHSPENIAECDLPKCEVPELI